METKMRIVIEVGNYFYRGTIFHIDDKKIVLDNCSKILEYRTLQNTDDKSSVALEEHFGGKVTFFMDRINLVFTPNWA